MITEHCHSPVGPVVGKKLGSNIIFRYSRESNVKQACERERLSHQQSIHPTALEVFWKH
jgi:hypothetical protein